MGRQALWMGRIAMMAEARMTDTGLRVIEEHLASQGHSMAQIEARLRAQRIETPSWGYGNSGTRFKVFLQPGVPRSVEEKLDDAAVVHRLTGVAPSVALHIPWDRVEDWSALRDGAVGRGLALGAINPNLFQDDAYKFGSLANPDPSIRRQAVDHCAECVAIARATGSRDISLWLADGTNYAGQDDLRGRRRRLIGSLEGIYAALDPGMRLLIEYKFYEPASYATDIPDWGTALYLCSRLGPQAEVLVDLGHHAQGVNIEQIVATLLDEGRLGGFHFNGRKYGDDDLRQGADRGPRCAPPRPAGRRCGGGASRADGRLRDRRAPAARPSAAVDGRGGRSPGSLRGERVPGADRAGAHRRYRDGLVRRSGCR